MKILDIENPEQLNIEFCKIVGIRPITGVLINKDTQEVRTYINTHSLYKTPAGWNNIEKLILNKPVYPNFLNIENFILLLELQWQMFGSLGGSYTQIKNENFICNYIYNKIKAIELLKSYGGSEMLDEFIKAVQELNYFYDIEGEVNVIARNDQ